MPSRSRALWATVLVAITLAAYAPALRSGFIWDDDAHVTENAALTAPAGLATIWLVPRALPQYYPLVHTTFWVERQLWGLQPLGYHLVNVLVHCLSALLLAWTLERLGVRGAWLAAGIFALHPVHVESVAWITELKNVLSGFFYFLSGICFLRYFGLIDTSAPLEAPPPASIDSQRSEDSRPLGWYVAAFALFVCALLSKTVTATLPLALLIVLWWKRERVARRDVTALVPPLVVGIAFGLVTLWLEKYHVGTQGKPFDLSWIERGLLAGRAVCFYLGKLLWPAHLSFFYSRWHIDAATAWQYAFPLAVLAAIGLLAAARSRIGKAPLAAALFFAVTLFPALGFFDVYPMRFSWVADHFQYLASVGIITLVSAGATGWLARRGPAWNGAAMAGAGTLLLILGVLTWRQTRMYADAETLWRATIARTPDAWIAHNNLGVLLMGRGDSRAAIDEYETTLRLEPELPDTHLNLGNLLAESGQPDKAIAHYDAAIRLDPKSAPAIYNLGNTLLEVGRVDEAIARYDEALRIAPAHTGARVNLGNALARRGRWTEAVAQYAEALRLDPGLAPAHNGLGVALAGQGKNGEAVEHYEQALRLDPDYSEAANNLGLALAVLDRWPEAVERFQLAIRIRPDYAEAHNNLGVALSRANRASESAEQFREALRIRPDFEDARANLRRVEEAPGRHL